MVASVVVGVLGVVGAACGNKAADPKPGAPAEDPWNAPAKAAPPADPWNTPAGAPDKPAADPPAPPAAAASRSTGGIAGVWYGMEFRDGYSYSGITDTMYANKNFHIAFVVLLPDGHLIKNAPEDGLVGLDFAAYAASPLGYLTGTYAFAGDAGEATTASGKQPMTLVDGELHLGKLKLKRVPDITGTKLDGTYTAFTNTADPYLDGPGCKQMITFHPDGTFDDRGAFVMACPPAPNEAKPPGTGTYAIRDYTLILTYADGHTVKRFLAPTLSGEWRPDVPHFVLVETVMNRRG